MPAKRVRLTPNAQHDIDEATVYLAREGGIDLGIGFFDAAHESFKTLLQMPGAGKSKELNNPRLSDLRQWHVSGYEKYLIFYRTVPTGIEIVRVLHGYRDVDSILEQE